jgi:hypothetical protein
MEVGFWAKCVKATVPVTGQTTDSVTIIVDAL